MQVFLIGAAGGVGRRLSSILVERGDTVTGMVRNAAQRDTVEGAGATAVRGDLVRDTVDELAQ